MTPGEGEGCCAVGVAGVRVGFMEDPRINRVTSIPMT